MNDGVEALAVLQAVDDRLARLVGVEPAEDVAGPVDGVDAAPAAGGVGALAGGADLDPQRALAAGLDHGVDGSIRIAKSAAISSGLLWLSR